MLEGNFYFFFVLILLYIGGETDVENFDNGGLQYSKFEVAQMLSP